MAVFVYKGFDAAGRNTSGIVDADSARLARGKLRKSGIFPTELSEERQQAAVPRGAEAILRRQFEFRQIFARVTETDKAILTRQLATLIGAGIPVVESLSALIDQVENPRIRVAVGQVRQRVNEGPPWPTRWRSTRRSSPRST
jgi:general secretion pathway protein F